MELDDIASALDALVGKLPSRAHVPLDASLLNEARETAHRFRRAVGHFGGGFDREDALRALESAESLLVLIADPRNPGTNAKRARMDLKRASAAIRRPRPRTGHGLER